ncbi:hypothetical protein ACE10Z_06910 [Bradyrhizobium sp. Pha-3]|uniref:hypothetical protein n=1 Tax=Bradyrhizobium sp. Pha-3 TaxID=208375 RepID=UPI0035D51DFB
MVAQLASERLARRDMIERVAQQLARCADAIGAPMRAPGIQAPHRDGKSFTLLAEQVFARNAAALEDHFGMR